MYAPHKQGIAGRIAAFFLHSHLTPLLALLALLLGAFAVGVTPREEEPQIDVTMANVLVPFPGAGVREVESMVAEPAEHVLSQMSGVEHVMSVARPGLAVLTVQFKVGVKRSEALVRLYDTVHSHNDWLPAGLGALPPVVKPKGIDDVPIVVLTLHSARNEASGASLEQVAHSMEADLKRVAGTREVTTIGGPGRAVNVEIDPARLAASGVTILDVGQALRSANSGAPVGELLAANRSVSIEVGSFLQNARDVAELVVGSHAGKPVFLREVANVRDGAPPAERYVWHGSKEGEQAAVMLAVTKKPGENAIDVAEAVQARVEQLKNAVIPADVQVSVTRNYGVTANDKATKLMQKLLFATLSVVALVGVALGKREAAIVGVAVVLTLAATLFASWAWGFTLNRVSLFALIFSIGILVDDAIVVVENIHRHQQLFPNKTLAELIPGAVDEVGGPTILATLTVIAALLPMAFVSGLMGPYMAPIPINASMGMLLSLAIAFVITPWLARVWMRQHAHLGGDKLAARLGPLFERVFRPLLDVRSGGRARRLLALGVAGLLALAVLLPVGGLVVLKMLPFDNKSEFQVVVDMPPGTPVEKTAAVLRAMGAHLAGVPEVVDYVASAGTAAPINFNGLVRQYYLRAGGEVGDIQVQLVDKHARAEKSHAIATRVRPALVEIGQRFGARVKVVEVPPGPPVLSPIVAEVYGHDEAGRRALARQVRDIFRKTPGVVDVDTTALDVAPRTELLVDRRKAAQLGVSQESVTATLQAALGGSDVSYLHDGSRYAVPTRIQLGPQWHGSLDALLQMGVRAQNGALVPVRELVTVSDSQREQPIYHKDLLPVSFVMGDMAGKLDSPLYGMFGMRGEIAKLKAPDGGAVAEYFIHQPSDAWRGYALKWDGEWQITYETFRDMGAAYAVGLVLIYLLVVAQFGSYLTPLIIMAPIPLTAIGVMPGHALLGAQFTATSMIGMIALAGIIVRNSILLVDFIQLELAQGRALAEAIVRSAAARAQPILLTGLAAMIGALFILDDPIFNGLAIALIFGILVSTVLTLVVIPMLYYVAYRNRPAQP
ncbi:efflux RND transporter permease subunit [Massilia sp. TS11]|uniref:efflux RND transporter permease subunit n=1 Tax=Massilia sp. TS11 TaxID=2908003 RepID=UPI001EDADC76|nr:efflux RND transporter permease subunit [Massilia sp. TS11]MCG2583807.1 efflux RND transporter permease subunit [Massilia sp. TS11]